MSKTVISVSNLSKSYLVGHETVRERYDSLRDSAARVAKTFARKTIDMARGRQIVQGDEVEEFWALKNVSFEVKRGEVVGIIGRNGAGKSTLLKVLSRITEPTEGRVVLGGRVASLLEVGTGFHPELTGRENIFLNGTILGMTRREIRKKFDEIVAFAGVEKFLDTPVKRYSSGMYVRLAFAVAAHLEPEILLVDEVLAVGDMEFQKKCLGKMNEVSKSGRTILFVSHNMTAIDALCTRGILLDTGRIEIDASTFKAVDKYVRKISSGCNGVIFASKESLVESIEISDELSKKNGVVPLGGNLIIKIRIADNRRPEYFHLAVIILDVVGNRLMTTHTAHHILTTMNESKSETYKCKIKDVRLYPGEYVVKVVLQEKGRNLEELEGRFSVREADVLGTGRLPKRGSGIIVPEVEWTVT